MTLYHPESHLMNNIDLKQALRKYKASTKGQLGRLDAAGNPIRMVMSFEEWISVWAESGHWHERGTRKGQYVMSRVNDLGNYEVGNVFIQLSSANCGEPQLRKRLSVIQKKIGARPEFRNICSSSRAEPSCFISPSGEKFEVQNVREFCRQHQLHHSAMVLVFSGKKPQHKGWTGYRVTRIGS